MVIFVDEWVGLVGWCIKFKLKGLMFKLIILKNIFTLNDISDWSKQNRGLLVFNSMHSDTEKDKAYWLHLWKNNWYTQSYCWCLSESTWNYGKMFAWYFDSWGLGFANTSNARTPARFNCWKIIGLIVESKMPEIILSIFESVFACASD